ncbi:hypothetical protein GGX14DRAFT_674937, partial [Mycena pura]
IMRTVLTTATLFILSSAALVAAGSSCIAFDTSWNLLAFGFGGKDYNAGTSDQWGSGVAPADITAQGRPPFDGNNTKCYLAEFFNAIYVLGADSSNLSNIYIFNAATKSWSTQATTAGDFDPSSFEAIVDHDTNVIYALSHGELWSLDMQELEAAQQSAIPWKDQGTAQITTTNYDPVMAIAQNHIFFFGVPGVPAGNCMIFLVSFWQPTPQLFKSDSTDFPDSHGQAVSFFLDTGVQETIAFIPDDGSHTYLVNVETNTTQTVVGPSTVDASATYFASTSALVQLSSSGAVSWLPFNPNVTSDNSNAAWSPVKNLATVAQQSGGGSSSASVGGSGPAGAPASKTASAGGSATSGVVSGSNPSPSGSGSNGASRDVTWGTGTVLGLVAIAFSLL